MQRTALITGANSGIGLELTRKLLKEDWHVVALNRSLYPMEDHLIQVAIKERRLREYRADLTDFKELRQALAGIQSQEPHIDLLFNNAGTSLPVLSFSPQGRELHYELQTVVPYIVLMELKELLKKGEPRVVINTSTSAFATLRTFQAHALERPTSFKKLFGPYAATKLALSLWTREMAPQLAEEGITIRSADPGGNNTAKKNNQAGLPFFIRVVMKLFFPPPTKGADLLYHAAVYRAGEPDGTYLKKGRVSDLPFVEQGDEVLAKVDSIYRKEYLPLA
jgi:NAD(P)-dependent dehydrogenase (short-subunit alcohol dehydrogenase family)